MGVTVQFCTGCSINRVDPTEALNMGIQSPNDWVERIDANGNKSIVWDENVTSADDTDLQESDRYLEKVVIVMDGSG